jgi:hypothetical protein
MESSYNLENMVNWYLEDANFREIVLDGLENFGMIKGVK